MTSVRRRNADRHPTLYHPRPPHWSTIDQQNAGRAATAISSVVHSLTVKLSTDAVDNFRAADHPRA